MDSHFHYKPSAYMKHYTILVTILLIYKTLYSFSYHFVNLCVYIYSNDIPCAEFAYTVSSSMLLLRGWRETLVWIPVIQLCLSFFSLEPQPLCGMDVLLCSNWFFFPSSI